MNHTIVKKSVCFLIPGMIVALLLAVSMATPALAVSARAAVNNLSSNKITGCNWTWISDTTRPDGGYYFWNCKQYQESKNTNNSDSCWVWIPDDTQPHGGYYYWNCKTGGYNTPVYGCGYVYSQADAGYYWQCYRYNTD